MSTEAKAEQGLLHPSGSTKGAPYPLLDGAITSCSNLKEEISSRYTKDEEKNTQIIKEIAIEEERKKGTTKQSENNE